MSAKEKLAYLVAPKPPTPEHDVFTPTQWDTLFAILEVFLPSISASADPAKAPVSRVDVEDAVSKLKPLLPEAASDGRILAYLADDAVFQPAFRAAVVRKFKLYVPPSDAKGLAFILSALNKTMGAYLLTGFTAPLQTLDLATRTKIVCQWSSARMTPLRAIYRSMAGLAKSTWGTASPSLYHLLDIPDPSTQTERSPSYEFKFHDFSSPSAPTDLSTDVIIIGSGCGAGVMSSHLSRAGVKCIILEKSYSFSASHFPMSSNDSGEHLMENGGVIMSDDGSTAILAASTFGGGGTVNWSAALQPPRAVREDWASDGLPHFLQAEYQDCLDTVCERMGVGKSTDPGAMGKFDHNVGNATLAEGARRLGMAFHIVPQNLARQDHACGAYCTYGCASTDKQGPNNCWFPDAANHGAEFIEGAWVEEVVFSVGPAGQKTATGVKATWTSRDRQISRQLTISAKRVVVASGSLNSPLVLQRSGLTNPNIGAHLYLHPTGLVWGVWPERRNPWEGNMLTVAVTEFENQDGAHHGPKIEVMCSTPVYGASNIPFRAALSTNAHGDEHVLASALDYRVNMAKFAHSSCLMCITRDTDTGRVYMDPGDPTRRRLRVAYTPSARDRANILAGQLGALRILYATGAVEIEASHTRSERWVRPSSLDAKLTPAVDNMSFDAWLKGIEALGFTSPECLAGSGHQMGSCRMGSSAKTGVVDAQGRVYGTRGLYVADASVFPSASGVNPMVCTMAIAEWISRGIVREIHAEA